MKRNSPAVRARAAGWNKQPARQLQLSLDKYKPQAPAPVAVERCYARMQKPKGGMQIEVGPRLYGGRGILPPAVVAPVLQAGLQGVPQTAAARPC